MKHVILRSQAVKGFTPTPATTSAEATAPTKATKIKKSGAKSNTSKH